MGNMIAGLGPELTKSNVTLHDEHALPLPGYRKLETLLHFSAAVAEGAARACAPFLD